MPRLSPFHPCQATKCNVIDRVPICLVNSTHICLLKWALSSVSHRYKCKVVQGRAGGPSVLELGPSTGPLLFKPHRPCAASNRESHRCEASRLLSARCGVDGSTTHPPLVTCVPRVPLCPKLWGSKQRWAGGSPEVSHVYMTPCASVSCLHRFIVTGPPPHPPTPVFRTENSQEPRGQSGRVLWWSLCLREAEMMASVHMFLQIQNIVW